MESIMSLNSFYEPVYAKSIAKYYTENEIPHTENSEHRPVSNKRIDNFTFSSLNIYTL